MTISGLYAITPDCNDTALLLRQVGAALAGGARILQYRNKAADSQLRFKQASALHALCREHKASFIINDDVDLALGVDADGVHLGMNDATIARARAMLGVDKTIGVSCYADFDRARNAAALGADYIAFGSFFSSSTKAVTARPTLGFLKRSRQQLVPPVVAIGGIDLYNARSVIAAGADAIAVISALFTAANIEVAARTFCNLFSKQHDFA